MNDSFETVPLKNAEEMSQGAAAYAKTGDQPERTFAQLGVPGPLVHVLAKDGKTVAFPIQADTLTDSLAGRDVLGRGETGSGKTLLSRFRWWHVWASSLAAPCVTLNDTTVCRIRVR